MKHITNFKILFGKLYDVLEKRKLYDCWEISILFVQFCYFLLNLNHISNFHVSKPRIFSNVNWLILYSETTVLLYFGTFPKMKENWSKLRIYVFRSIEFPYCKMIHSVLRIDYFPNLSGKLQKIPAATSPPKAQTHLPGYRFSILSVLLSLRLH